MPVTPKATRTMSLQVKEPPKIGSNPEGRREVGNRFSQPSEEPVLVTPDF